MRKDLQIIFPSSPCSEATLQKTVKDLEDRGFRPSFQIPIPNSELPFLSSTFECRLSELSNALLDPSNTPVLCARGGYGASELLPFLPWEKLKEAKPKWLVGFSDISALQTALYTQLGWPSIHGPMPGSELWGKNGSDDVNLLLNLLESQKKWEGQIKIQPISEIKIHRKEAWLFGGCLSVLCNLIGTPYFPKSLRGAIVFLEDVGECSGRILRMLTQLMLSGLLNGAEAIVFGNFGEVPNLNSLQNQFSRKLDIPMYRSGDFGHISPNFPLMIGSKARLSENHLYWSLEV